MTVYIDADFACHLADDGSMTAVEVDMFDGKCPEFIEAYRCVPQGQTWIRPDGMRFEGMLLAPMKAMRAPEAAQRAYEAQQLERLRAELADMRAALRLQGVTDNE